MSDDQILVSIIVPAHNARSHLESSLPAIRRSDYPYFELIVVDDNSTDGSSEFAEEYADIVIKAEKRGGPAKARNRGVQTGKGSILFFVDADVQIAPDTVTLAVKTMKESPDIAAVFGSYDEKPFFKNFFSQNKNLFHHFIHQNANPEASTFWAGCGAVRKEDFCEAGGFTEKYTCPSIEDVELGYRLTEAGKKITLLKEMQVRHLKKWSFVTVLKSDIMHRAIPWTKLACEKGLPCDLNFKLSHRVSGMIACLLFLSLILMWRWKSLTVLSIILAAAFLYLNKDLYKFFIKKRGGIFAARAVFFHWFYSLYSSATFLLFSVFFFIKRTFSHEKVEV